MISMDAQDVSGMTLTDIMHNVFKRRLDSDGRPLGRVERNLLGNAITKEEDLLKEKQRAMTEGRPTVTAANAAMLGQKCGSCYGAGEGNQCCQTCDEVRDAYRKKGWSFDPSTAEQCSQEGLISDVQVPPDKLEGCNLYGFVKVPRGSGNIHFAPGRAFQAAHAHVDDLLTFTADKFNISHRVNNFSFGDYYQVGRGVKRGEVMGGVEWRRHFILVSSLLVLLRFFFPLSFSLSPCPSSLLPLLSFPLVSPFFSQDRVNPLDGVEHSLASGSGIQQYYLKVVPTEFEYVNGRRVISNQFSATSHLREIDVTNPRNVPGVFFSFDLSPIRVHIIERRRSFGHFLTNLCAIIGGVFTVMGLVDSTLHGILNRSAGRGRPGGILERD